MKGRFAAMVPVLVGAWLVGCTPLPLVDMNHEPVQRQDGKTLSVEDMGNAIRMAALMEEWQPELVAPGHIVATRHDDDDEWVLSVDILYTSTEYSVDYKDSRGLNYDPARRTIAHHAHGMMLDLEDRIRDAVQDITPASAGN